MARKEILKIHSGKKPLDSSVSLDRLVEITDGMTDPDISSVVNTAAMAAIKDQISADKKSKLKVTMSHFEKALKKIDRKNKIACDTLA